MKSLGAVRVIDYTREDFVRPGDSYDLVFDAVGRYPRARARQVLEKNGRFLSSHDSHGSPKLTAGDLEFIGTLLRAKKIKSVIDRRYSLDQIVDAHRYVERGHKKGNVVISLD